MAEAAQSPAAVLPNPNLPMAERIYDLASLLSCVADRVAEVHSRLDPAEADDLWDALRSLRHCHRVAGAIASDVEEAPYV